MNAMEKFLKANGWKKLTKTDTEDFVPELPSTAKVFQKFEHQITIYPVAVVYDGSTGVSGKQDAGDWELCYNEGAKVKFGNGLAKLKKVLAKPLKSDPDCYVYELSEVKARFKRGMANAYLFMPNDGRIIEVKPTTFEKAKKLYMWYGRKRNGNRSL